MELSNMSEFKSKIIMARSGKLVETKPHFATFDDKHNASKSRVLITLYHRKYKLNDNTGLSVGELHRQSGVNYDYIKSRVTRWAEWGYLGRSIRNNDSGRPLYVYTLAKRGRHFIEDILPQEWLKQYIAEIQAFKATQS